MPADFRWRTRALWRGMLACDALLAPSESFAEATSRTYETPLPFVVRNGRARPDAPAPGERQALVFTSGRLWDEGKNVAVLDAAARLIEAPLLAAGPLEAPGGANRIALAAARPLGRLDAEAVAAWLRRARIYASSARYEPFGLGVLEAAQAGCALVLSDIPTFRELWDGAALFAPADDPAAFAAACGTLLADEAQALRLGRRARARARRFSVEAMSAGVLEVYRHVLSQRTGAMGARAVA
jgi:glycosyltransferase involved in cell wall biosynthesis